MWERKEFEVNDNPEEGDDVPYAVLRVSELHRHGNRIEAEVFINEVVFFMREPKENGKEKSD